MNTQDILKLIDKKIYSMYKVVTEDWPQDEYYSEWQQALIELKKEIQSLPYLDIDTQWIDVNEVYKKLDELQEKESRNFEPMATLVSLWIKQAKSAIYEIATKKFPNN